MQTTYRPAPSFPPVDALLSLFSSIDWRRIGTGILTAALAAAALAYCLGQRCRRAVGPAAAEALRTMADAIDVPAAADPLEALPVRELRILARQAGHRALARSGRRADLLAALGA